ncbi:MULTISPECIES: HrcA family transcriptional regulator [Campylobacter]|uniref:Heat-inducible transcription repressor n=1 Tax=Campylobacter porcelli TaxID=1660073 RepID=A0A1X9SX16_9BACT|nr:MULTISPECIES: HrcA family transcriptional regulator [unclassified Campylobacter]MCR8678363.1 HrcA family transcriptional regulator [Campylobacter sp. RM19072]MCR8695714.1 HrcA family transcriptional regulator [Campylobacter sp. RM19073]MEE3704284.1 HrcA family transcriptional regulator [Campylobacter sp. CX2-8023-23]MEE3743931.1 HrcA family transcriptional regulator [Campylobacter sp. CX2-4855-23]MEE3776189.1 HrcA family transcriptional regulator [Campylobacter sp. CX2-4080-23]
MKVDKRDLILESIIHAYLEANEPIGSSELGMRMNIAIPASTIRVYFKKLSDEGAITQLHISGGRIPTASAMEIYWQNRLKFSPILSINNIDLLNFLVYKNDIYCMIFENQKLFLKDVLNLKDRFLVLDFNTQSISIKFSSKVEKFLSNLIGVSLEELDHISMQVGLSELRVKIKALKREEILFQENEKIAFEICKDDSIKAILDPSFGNNFNGNLAFSPLFSTGYMGLKTDVIYQGKPAIMLCASSVYSDYEKFLSMLKEAA